MISRYIFLNSGGVLGSLGLLPPGLLLQLGLGLWRCDEVGDVLEGRRKPPA